VEPYEVSSVLRHAEVFLSTYHDVVHIDHEGEELADKHAARQEATRMAGDIMKDIDGKLRPGHDWKLEVEDEFKNVLWALHVKAEQPK
jgi:hypothetical protein